jgi:hypothetical protein
MVSVRGRMAPIQAERDGAEAELVIVIAAIF